MLRLILGFIGGVVAIGIKAAIDYWFELRRERRLIRTPARLVDEELGRWIASVCYAQLAPEAARAHVVPCV